MPFPAKQPSSPTGCIRTVFAMMENPDTVDAKRVLVNARAHYQSRFKGNPNDMNLQTVHQVRSYLRGVCGRPLVKEKVAEYVARAHSVNGQSTAVPVPAPSVEIHRAATAQTIPVEDESKNKGIDRYVGLLEAAGAFVRLCRDDGENAYAVMDRYLRVTGGKK